LVSNKQSLNFERTNEGLVIHLESNPEDSYTVVMKIY
jgi:hypothetical protein